MDYKDKIKNSLSQFKSTIIMEKFIDLDFDKIGDGILIVYAAWSGPAIRNYSATIEFLKTVNYNKTIIVVDTDNISPEQQIAAFGKVLGGAGEIFVIKNGIITEKYFGYSSFDDFSKNYELNTTI